MEITNWDRIGELVWNKFSIGVIAESKNGKFYLKASTEDAASIFQSEAEKTFYSTGLKAPNALFPLGTSKVGSFNFLVFPYVSNDLTNYVKKVSSTRIINEVLLPIIEFLEALHSKGYIHGDLKLENIRVEEYLDKLSIYVSDFGKTKLLQGHMPNRLSYLSQHTSPDLTISPQIDIYSLGVMAFQLMFGFDFLKNYQLNGRNFEKILGPRIANSTLLEFIKRATEPSALFRLNSASECRRLLCGELTSSNNSVSVSQYHLQFNFEIYLEAMKDTFVASGKSLSEFEGFIGPYGETYYSRLEKWSKSPDVILLQLKSEGEIIGISEASIRNSKGMISTLFVREDKRGQGFGQILEECVIDFFKKKGVSELRLNVSESNQKAISFYFKTGWNSVSERQYQDAIQMQKFISK